MKAELIPLNGDPPIPIRRDVTIIGRREDQCDQVVPHPSLSKRHCVLVRTDDLLIIRDLISTNGTKVNGQRVSWAALMPNDRLTLGRVKFKVYTGPDDMPAPSERPPSRRAPIAPTLEEFDDDAFIPVAAPLAAAPPRPAAAALPDGLEILDDPADPNDEFIVDLE